MGGYNMKKGGKVTKHERKGKHLSQIERDRQQAIEALKAKKAIKREKQKAIQAEEDKDNTDKNGIFYGGLFNQDQALPLNKNIRRIQPIQSGSDKERASADTPTSSALADTPRSVAGPVT